MPSGHSRCAKGISDCHRPALADASEWQESLPPVCGRGTRRKRVANGKMQHDLELKRLFKTGLFDRISLLRGEIDAIIHRKKERLRQPGFHSRSMWSLWTIAAGLFYRDRRGNLHPAPSHRGNYSGLSPRPRPNFVLLISCNLDSVDQGRSAEDCGKQSVPKLVPVWHCLR